MSTRRQIIHMFLSQRTCVDDVSCATVTCAQHEINLRLCHAFEVCCLHVRQCLWPASICRFSGSICKANSLTESVSIQMAANSSSRASRCSAMKLSRPLTRPLISAVTNWLRQRCPYAQPSTNLVAPPFSWRSWLLRAIILALSFGTHGVILGLLTSVLALAVAFGLVLFYLYQNIDSQFALQLNLITQVFSDVVRRLSPV